ncbi:DJ-1/PfpI family protein [Ottowia sp. SB7-C50]|uniref:DJ-1/PfpI family protein n=1 Tax=Ottowia sp. SB7-C50 TaxID=3081231 RepID=UPI002952D6D8|nr:DJ-1/PfpI family protein [Ottowia sp. SB7-C50]WOP14220.1 DJ-1/PfpI family protein [Ottowia sp. SB7-C50]
MTWRVQLLAFDDMEALDFAGPYEVFTTAARLQARAAPGAPPLFDVTTVAQRLAPVRARAGLRVLPDHDFAAAPPVDLLVVPGGVVDGALACRETLRWIARQSLSARITASVCTGAFLLAAAGVVTHGPVTTHWEDVADLRARWPALQVLQGPRWVDRGGVVTSAGISAGIDMSLHLVERLASRELAERTARQMDFAWEDRGHTVAP